MKRTGIFFTYFRGDRLKDFPQALNGIISQDNIYYYDAVYTRREGLYYLEPVSEDLLLQVHTAAMIKQVKKTGDYQSALYSAGGTVQAALEIQEGKLDNAFVFTGFGDHHAGRSFYGGQCYFNGAALAIASLKKRGVKRFAIVDTDSHHADGTRDICGTDDDVLHICFCNTDSRDNQNNIDINIPRRSSDEEFLAKMRQVFVPRVMAFRPDYIFWEYGYDATKGEYGDKGLTRDCHVRIAELIKGVADKVSRGRLIVILCGGSGRATATYTIPRIIDCLGELGIYS